MKPTILLLHGAIGAEDQLAPLEQLLSSDFDVLKFSFVGHGQRESTDEPFSIEYFADDLKRFLDKHQLKRIKAFGYSMGGYVAMHLAHRYPEYFSSIYTLGTKYHWSPEIAAKETKMLNADKIEEKVPAFAKALEVRHGDNGWKNVLKKTEQMLIGLGENNALQLDDYRSMSLPVIVMLGDQDHMVTKEESIAVAEVLPNGRFLTLVDSLHPIEKVNLPELVRILKDE